MAERYLVIVNIGLSIASTSTPEWRNEETGDKVISSSMGFFENSNLCFQASAHFNPAHLPSPTLPIHHSPSYNTEELTPSLVLLIPYYLLQIFLLLTTSTNYLLSLFLFPVNKFPPVHYFSICCSIKITYDQTIMLYTRNFNRKHYVYCSL